MAKGLARGAASTAASVLLCVVAVLYNDWLLQFFVTTGLSQANSYVSETFAADQPHRLLFGAVELSCAAFVITAAALAARSLPWGLALAGWGAVGVFGGCSVLDVLLPMGCAPSVEHGCPADNVQHTTTSGLVECALFVSMALFGLAARRSGPRRPGWAAGRWAPYLMPVSMAAAIATVGPYLGHPGGQGIAQRIHLISVAVWFVLLAVEAGRTGPLSYRGYGGTGGRGRGSGREGRENRGGRSDMPAGLATVGHLAAPLPDAQSAPPHGRRTAPERSPRPSAEPSGRRGRITDGQ